MKKLYLPALLLLLYFTATAQYTTSWSWVKGTAAYRGYSLQEDLNGNIVSSGHFWGTAFFDSLKVSTGP
ncbi:MAG: hypothetical protein LPK19_00335, partial [Hymenobacteraceae bacterium]|nr:hypothetical protein [Hymenobacteraceae bacterium]MDX5394616.1 hypothetical protein [Hymenobacteraceae bacterium]MDX5510647.1 hypothetical protein [Hymenobacteraceae bacterium]